MQTITETTRLDTIADNVIHREREVFAYQINIDNYTTMLTALPDGDWPAHLAQYASTPTDALPFDLSDKDVQAVADLQYRDNIRRLLRSEKVEQSKARRVYDALVAQLPADQAESMIAAAKARVDAAQAV